MGELKARVKNLLTDDNIDRTLILITAFSIFVHYVLCGLCMIIAAVRALCIGKSRSEIVKTFDFKLLIIFALVNIATPLFFKNYAGFLCFFGVLIVWMFSVYVRLNINESTAAKIFDIVCFVSPVCAVCAAMQKTELKIQAPSVFYNANYYGMVISFVVIICFYRLLTTKARRLPLIFSVIVNLFGLFLSDCWTGYITVALGVLLLLLFTKKRLAALILAAAGAISVLIASRLEIFGKIFKMAEKNITIRSGIWKSGILGFCEHPIFGRGMLGYMQLWERFGSQRNFHCHNLLIDLLLSFGIVGAVPLVIFAWRSILKFKKNRYTPLLFTLLIMTAVHSLVDVTLVWIQCGCLAALLMALPYAEKK